ncbi:UNVERIFIED_CONTAM: hypothetical protein NCL1_00189 [Trichonephila clavipes]
MRRVKRGLGFQCHRIGHQPRALGQQRPEACQQIGRQPAADKHRIGARQVRDPFGAVAVMRVQAMGQTEGFGICADVRQPVGAGLYRRGAATGKAPFNRNRAGPSTQIPQMFTRARCQRGQRQRAHRGLGDLAIALEQHVRQAGCAGQAGVVRLDGCQKGGFGGVRRCRADTLLRAAKPFQQSDAGVGMAVGDQPVAKPGRRRAVAQGDQRAGAACQQRSQSGAGRGVKAEAKHLLHAPAEPVAGQLKGRGRGVADPFSGRKVADQAAARAMPERIARGQNHGAPPARRQHRGGGKRHRPGHAAPARLCQRQMARPADDDFSRIQQVTACGGQPVKAIFAQTEDMEPGISHDAHSSSGRHHRGERPCAGLGRDRGGCGVFLCRAHRCPLGPAPADPCGGLWRDRRAGGLAAGRGDHACDRRDPSLRGANEPQCRHGLRRHRRCAGRAGASGMAGRAGRPLDLRARSGGSGGSAARDGRTGVSGDRQAACRGFRRETRQPLSAAAGRSAGRAAAARRDGGGGARSLRSGGRSGPDAGSSHHPCRRQECRGRRCPCQGGGSAGTALAGGDDRSARHPAAPVFR